MKSLGTLVLLGLITAPAGASSPRLSANERRYLMGLAEATYRCLKYYTHPETALPYDNSQDTHEPFTTITNVGLAMAVTAAAVDLELEPRAQAIERLQRMFDALEHQETWEGLAFNWIHTGRRQQHQDRFVSTVDLGNYVAGRLVACQAFPELAHRCQPSSWTLHWDKLYDHQTRLLWGGRSAKTGTSTDWHYQELGSEARLAVFLAVASNAIPAESWDALNRTLEERYQVEYLKPGWHGGLFTHFLPGIFLDERDTLMGRSAINFALAQMRHAKRLKSPVWGWSPSTAPQGGYLGVAALRDTIVTPHASALAAEVFPKEVVGNLKELERRGTRPLHVVKGVRMDFGFRDAYDTSSDQVTRGYLYLDQAMLFLSLANALHERVVSRWFESHPMVQAGRQRISDFRDRPFAQLKGEPPFALSHLTGLPTVSFDRPRPQWQVVRSTVSLSLADPLSRWAGVPPLTLGTESLEQGTIEDAKDLAVTSQWVWDEESLAFVIRIHDDELVVHPPAQELYKGDCIELYIDPTDQGFAWGNAKQFQLGVSAPTPEGHSLVYAWFQKRAPTAKEFAYTSERTADGYTIRGLIRWSFLGVTPTVGTTLGVSLAVHDVDTRKGTATKLNWFFQQGPDRISLGQFILASPPGTLLTN